MKWLLGILTTIYLLLCGSLYSIQEKVIFRPEKISESYNFGIGEEVEIALDDDLQMNALWVKENPSSKSDKAILYLKGNRGSIRFGTYQIRQMKHNGYDILIPDYRSYGKTEGEPKNNKQLLRDADISYQFLKQHYQEENIVVIGYSLGTGMASYVASQNNPMHLLLIAPFTSLVDIKNQFLWFMPDFLLKYKLNNKKHLAKVKCPVTLLHGTRDQIVKYDFSEALSELYPSKVRLITVNGEGHRGIIFEPKIRDIIEQL